MYSFCDQGVSHSRWDGEPDCSTYQGFREASPPRFDVLGVGDLTIGLRFHGIGESPLHDEVDALGGFAGHDDGGGGGWMDGWVVVVDEVDGGGG